MTFPAEKLAQVGDLGLSISGPWWTPERIAFHNGLQWQTSVWPQYQYNSKVKQSQTIAVSSVGADGLAHFIAWDVDSGNPQDARAILEAMPKGIVPLVSASGKKGWHVWVFPFEPLLVETAIAFARAIQERAGISCEIFPSSKRSRCLKWPLSVHPETGKLEVFVREDDLTSEYDTQVILEGLAGGMWRTPASVIEGFVEADTPKKPKEKRATKARPAQWVEGHTLPTGKLLPEGVNLAAIPEIAFGLAELCGKRVSRIGQAFRCILPGHEERHPSASFWRGDNGTIVYHCFHHEKHGTPEFLTLGEVYHAVATGQIRKLSPVEASKWLCRLALRLDFQTQAVVLTKEKLTSLDSILIELGLCKQRVDIYSPVVCKNKRVKVSEAKRIKDSRDLAVEKVWHVLCEEALLSALAGFNEIKLSARFLAEEAGLPLDLANRTVNLLAAIGIVEKVPGSGGMKGDRFTLGNVDVEEARRRLNALFPNGRVDLREFKAKLVAERLGEETAKAIFRRQTETVAETVEGTVSQTVSETASQTCHESADIYHESADNHHVTRLELLAGIRAAEEAGQWEEVERLLRLYMEELQRRTFGEKPEKFRRTFGELSENP